MSKTSIELRDLKKAIHQTRTNFRYARAGIDVDDLFIARFVLAMVNVTRGWESVLSASSASDPMCSTFENMEEEYEHLLEEMESSGDWIMMNEDVGESPPLPFDRDLFVKAVRLANIENPDIHVTNCRANGYTKVIFSHYKGLLKEASLR